MSQRSALVRFLFRFPAESFVRRARPVSSACSGSVLRVLS